MRQIVVFEDSLAPAPLDMANLAANGFDLSVGHDRMITDLARAEAVVLVDCRRDLALLERQVGYRGASTTPRIVAIAGELSRPLRERILGHGADDVVDVAATPAELLARIRAALLRDGPIRVLVVEDEEPYATEIVEALARAGYETRLAKSLADAGAVSSAMAIDVMVVDRMLPDGDGLEFLSRLRRDGNRTPAIIASNLTALSHRLRGLEGGANDYLAKPFDELELVARVQVLLRPRVVDDVVHFGLLEMSRKDRVARWRGERIDLSPKEFRLLDYLLAREGIALPTTMLRADVWDQPHRHTEGSVVAVGVRRLREKLREAGLPDVIATEPTGYRLDLRPILSSSVSVSS